MSGERNTRHTVNTALTVLVLACAAVQVLRADTFYVNGTTGNDAWNGRCAEWDGGVCGPKLTIQAGINAADAGDEVIIAPGVYTGPGNKDIEFDGRAITLRSTNPADWQVVQATVIDCEGDGTGFYFFGSDETNESVIAGLTVRNADDNGFFLWDSSPTIRRCLITNNASAGSGGGIFGKQTSAYIEDCRIVGNSSGSASGYGGGIHLDYSSHATIRNCQITDNTSQYYGGGVSCARSSDPVFDNCEITDNQTVFYDGGGISVRYNAAPTFRNCVITGNDALDSNANGGGIRISDADATFVSCVIADNYAQQDGGGIYCLGTLTLRNCTIVNNLAHRNGGGIRCLGENADVTIANSIMWDNEAWTGDGEEISLAGTESYGYSQAHVNYCNVQGGVPDVDVTAGCILWWGYGNISKNPLLVYEDPRYTLPADSPCVDAGDPEFVPDPGEKDLLGHYRVWDGNGDDYARVDMGVHERGSCAYGDLNCDQSVDAFDIDPFVLALTAPDAYEAAFPACDIMLADIDGDGAVSLFDIDPFVDLMAG